MRNSETENIWFVCSETSYGGDERRCYQCGTNDRTLKQFGGTLKANGGVIQGTFGAILSHFGIIGAFLVPLSAFLEEFVAYLVWSVLKG